MHAPSLVGRGPASTGALCNYWKTWAPNILSLFIILGEALPSQ
jgi:hypothetical protein